MSSDVSRITHSQNCQWVTFGELLIQFIDYFSLKMEGCRCAGSQTKRVLASPPQIDLVSISMMVVQSSFSVLPQRNLWTSSLAILHYQIIRKCLSADWHSKYLANKDLCAAVQMTYAKQIQNFSPVHAPCGPLVASESRDLIRGERAGGTDNMGCELDHIAQRTAFCLKQQVQQEPEAPGAMLDFGSSHSRKTDKSGAHRFWVTPCSRTCLDTQNIWDRDQCSNIGWIPMSF